MPDVVLKNVFHFYMTDLLSYLNISKVACTKSFILIQIKDIKYSDSLLQMKHREFTHFDIFTYDLWQI